MIKVDKFVIDNTKTDYCVCNKCGNIMPKYMSTIFKHTFGYFSKNHDMDKMKLTICDKCLSEFVDQCEISPIVG